MAPHESVVTRTLKRLFDSTKGLLGFLPYRRSSPMSRNRRELLAGIALAGVLLAGCLDEGDASGDDGDPDEPTPSSGTPAVGNPNVDEPTLSAVVADNTAFALDLHRELVDYEPGENLFVSPYSISVALAMTWAGARGETADEMAETLRFAVDQDDLHPAFAALQAELGERGADDEEEDQPFEFNDANALWGLDEYPYRESFLETTDEHYGAGLRTLDFAADPEAARQEINEWIETETEERIDELLPENSVDEDTRLVLTNAIYFLATWAKTFSEDATEDRPFTALDGSTADVPLMSQSERFPYAEVDGHQVIELPYVGEEVGMVVILPAAGEFETVEQELDGERLAELFDALDDREGRIELPRFEFESGVDLSETLAGMGMPTAFEEGAADFSGMADPEAAGEGLFIGGVYHDAFVAVDEEGTEAAAATGVVMQPDSAPLDPFEMTVDRPFLFAIRDRPTDAILFLGRVVDAPAAQG